jgi:hypothetical protein
MLDWHVFCCYFKIEGSQLQKSCIVKIIGIPLLCALFCLAVFSQERIKEVLTIKTEKPIDIDGLLNESIWRKAPDASLLIQQDPGEEDSGRFQTEVKILFDDDHIYFGFLCHDPEPDKILGDTIKIDGDLRDTDSMYILIDSFDDPARYLFFAVNFLSAKADGKVSKDGQSADYGWDGEWEAVGRRTDFGWSAEVALERKCLFEDPKESETLGLSLARVVSREASTFYSGPLDPPFDFSQIAPLQGLSLAGLELGASIHPHVIARVESGADTEAGAGLDAQYAFSQQTHGRLVVYPDFATVEPDEERINLTPFELYLPEKRDFFLDGPDYDDPPIQLFYTKRIGDLYGGARFQGAAGSFVFSGMSTQTEKQEDPGEASANFSVFSLEKKGRPGSAVFGLTAANKWIESQNTGTAGVYSDIPVMRNLRLSGQFAFSYGDHSKGNLAFFLGPSYDTESFHMHLHYIHLDENFGDNVNQVGFIPDDNRRELDSAIHISFPFKEGFLSQIRYQSNYNIYWGMDGTLRSWRIDQGFQFFLRSKFSLSAAYTQEYMLNEYFLDPEIIFQPAEGGKPARWIKKYIKDFRNDRVKLQSLYWASTWNTFGLSVTAGRNFKSFFQVYEIFEKLKITEKLFTEYNFCFLDYEDERFFKSTTIHVLKFIFYTNKNLTWKLFIQTNKAIEKTNIHVMCLYNIRPIGIVQLVYQKGTAAFGTKGTQDHTLFVKLSRKF